MAAVQCSFRLPRRTAFQHIRHFHPTRPSPFINEVLDASSTFIHGVHSVSHLPWVLSLPLTALIVRTTVAMPLQIYTKLQARRELELISLKHSWSITIQRAMNARRPWARPKDEAREIAKRFKERTRILHKRWGVHRFYKFANFLQIPIWLSIMESIRAMSGNKSGLVPYLLSRMEPSSAAETTGSSVHLALEPSLATEGALWFPDLLAGDPTGILSTVLTLSILVNIRAGWKTESLSSMSEMPRVQMAKSLSFYGLRRLIQVLALNIGVSSYMYEMPAALMVYWITSTNIATLQTAYLQKFMFARKPLPLWKKVHMECKKPGQEKPVEKS